jgi:hypothetical protein
MNTELLREKIANFLARVQLDPSSSKPKETIECWLDPAERAQVADEIIDLIVIHVTEKLAL